MTEDEVDSLNNHIHTLTALEHGIKVDYYLPGRMQGMMFVEEDPPRIEIPPTTGLIPYLIALHEIGHCVLGHTQGRPPHQDKRYYFDHGVVRCEAEAWEWAMKNSIVGWGADEVEFMYWTCLGSYRRAAKRMAGRPTRLGNGNRHWVEFVYDDPDSGYVMSVVQQMFSIRDFLNWGKKAKEVGPGLVTGRPTS